MDPSKEKAPYWIRFEGSDRWVAIPEKAMLEIIEAYFPNQKYQILKLLHSGSEIKVSGGYIATYETALASSQKPKIP